MTQAIPSVSLVRSPSAAPVRRLSWTQRLPLAALGTQTGTVLTWVFNTFGTADLLFAFYLGSRIALPDNPGLLGAGYFILTAYVPLLLITHGLAFRILLRTKVVVPSPSQVRTA